MRNYRRESNLTNNGFYLALKRYIETNGYVPTIREFGDFVGLNSPATVLYHLRELEQKGLIKRINSRKIIFLKEK